MNIVEMETQINGLWCRQCEDILCHKLNYTKGVISASISYWKGNAVIQYDADIIDEAGLKESLSKAGYPATEKKISGIWYDVSTILLIITLYILMSIIKLPGIPKADNGVSYLRLSIIGLVTGTHCMMMCGGIMLSQTADKRLDVDNNKRRNNWRMTQYQLSRVFTGVLLGFIFGVVGDILIFSEKAKSMFYVFTGVYILFIGLSMWGLPGIRHIQSGLPSLCKLTGKYHKVQERGCVIAGIITAIMPCAASNSMWILAMSSGSGIKGACMMLVWGLGTIPCMLVLGWLVSIQKRKYNMVMFRINIVLLITLGIKMFMMGIY